MYLRAAHADQTPDTVALVAFHKMAEGPAIDGDTDRWYRLSLSHASGWRSNSRRGMHLAGHNIAQAAACAAGGGAPAKRPPVLIASRRASRGNHEPRNGSEGI